MPQSLSLILPNDPTRSISMQQFLQQVAQVATAGATYGTTSQRPTTNLYIGQTYLDTTLQEMVVWNGTSWIVGGSGGGGVTSIIAGTGISVSSPTGNVTITNTGESLLTVSATTSAGTYYPVIVNGASGALPPLTSGYLTFDPSTGILTAQYFNGESTFAGYANAAYTNIASNLANITYPIFLGNAGPTLPGNVNPFMDTNLSWNPYTKVLGVPTGGSFNGNAATATTASTASLATDATNIGITSNTTNANYWIPYVFGPGGGYQAAWAGSGLTYNPATSTVTASTFNGTANSAVSTNSVYTNVAGTGANISYPIFLGTAGATLPGNDQPFIDVNITWNPFTKILSVPTGGSFNGNAATATTASTSSLSTDTTNVGITNNTTNTNFWLPFVTGAGGGYQPVYANSNITVNPSTATITATTFSGALNGNASTATSASSSSAVNVTNSTSNTNYDLLFATSSGTAETVFANSGMTINPATSTITASTFNGISNSSVFTNSLYTNVAGTGANISYPIFLGGAGPTLPGNESAYMDTNITWNPLTKILSVPSGGSFNGNAATATTASTASLATNATNIGITSNTTNTNYQIPYVFGPGGGYQAAWTGSGLQYNPSTAGGMTITTTGSTKTLAITDTGSTGVSILLTGNGGTAPAKSISVLNGELSILNNAGSSIMNLGDAGKLQVTSLGDINTNLIMSSTAPTISSGFGTSPSILAHNTAAFQITIGTSPGNNGVIALPTASNGWVVTGSDITSTNIVVSQIGSGTSSATIGFFSRTTGAATSPTSGDKIVLMAHAF